MRAGEVVSPKQMSDLAELQAHHNLPKMGASGNGH